jgi:hypothetical protein
MSSQGPSVGTTTQASGNNGCFSARIPSQVAPGYTFNTSTLRDASDWISYKKRQLILKEEKTKTFQDPWFVHGNNYRMDYLGGKYQNGSAPVCGGCDGAAYNTNGPFTS